MTVYATSTTIVQRPQKETGFAPATVALAPEAGPVGRKRRRELALHEQNLKALEAKKASRLEVEWPELDRQIGVVQARIAELVKLIGLPDEERK
jgi:hypothetical protein